MPVRVSADRVELQTAAGIATIADTTTSTVVPVFVGPEANDLVINASTTPSQIQLHLLRDDERLVADCTNVSTGADALFPGNHVLAFHLTGVELLSGPPAAWQTLDAVLLTPAEAERVDDAHRSALLGSGTLLAVVSSQRPDPRWPWTQRGPLWVLQLRPVGPVDGLINADVFGPVSAILPGLPADQRRGFAAAALLLAAVLVAARFVPWPQRYLLGVCLITFVTAYVWRQTLPAAVRGQGKIITQQGELQRQDTWLYQVGRADGVNSIAWSGFTRPVFPNEAALAAAEMKIVVDSTVRFEYRSQHNRAIAFLRSDVSAATAVNPSTITTPLRSLAFDAYVQPGVTVTGSCAASEGWPSTTLQDDRDFKAIFR